VSVSSVPKGEDVRKRRIYGAFDLQRPPSGFVPCLLGMAAKRSNWRRHNLKERRERIEHLEQDANALLEHYASMVPEALDVLTPEERHRIYKMMRLNVTECNHVRRWTCRGNRGVQWVTERGR
jgi:hypothetical protein